VIQNCSGAKKDQNIGPTLCRFQQVCRELKTIFSITSYVKQMPDQWNKTDGTYFSQQFFLKYILAQVIRSSAVSFLVKTYGFLHSALLTESQNLTVDETQERSSLVAHGRQSGRRGDFGGKFVGHFRGGCSNGRLIWWQRFL